MKFLSLICGLLLISICLSACSVGMALSGSESPDLSVVKTGADRSTVELQLGKPVAVSTDNEGYAVCKYVYEIGNDPSAGRAAFHGTMDVVTLGFWEIIGTPVEGFTGDKRAIMITYNSDDKITKVN